MKMDFKFSLYSLISIALWGSTLGFSIYIIGDNSLQSIESISKCFKIFVIICFCHFSLSLVFKYAFIKKIESINNTLKKCVKSV